MIKYFPFLKKMLSCIIMILFILTPLICVEKKEKSEKKKQKLPKIIEEIVVIGEVPAKLPLSSVSVIKYEKLEKISPKSLGEVMNYAAGTYVTEGQKNESNIQIRGLSSNRLTLLYDGVPIYEPYFYSFDLKNIAAAGIERIKVIRGSHSVLYGANTLGGVINVLSHRPTSHFLSLHAQVAEANTIFLSTSAGYNFNKLHVNASAALDFSDGFYWQSSGNRTLRKGSDYNRFNIAGKVYVYPLQNSEIMFQVLYHDADYGIPAAMEFLKPRYWRFRDWDRLQLNLGATFPLTKRGNLIGRAYYVHHHNVLDAYETIEWKDLQWRSTYNNYSLGAFFIGEYMISSKNQLKISLNLRKDHVKIQDDIAAEWDEYDRDTYSLGFEDHIIISARWKLITGASIDYLKKNSGENRSRINPLIGIKFSLKDYVDFRLSLSQKSRFPSMRSLYSSKSGNPDLKDETGRNLELGFTYKKNVSISGAIFYNRIHDMIQSYRGLEGYKNYQNIGRAEMVGFEVDFSKRVGIFTLSMNYTNIIARDSDTKDTLDYVPRNQLNGFIQVGNVKGFSFFLWGYWASKSQAKLGNSPPFEVINIPGYALVNARIEKELRTVTLYIKVENLLNNNYYTEPGFPMKSRTFSGGIQAKFGGNRE